MKHRQKQGAAEPGGPGLLSVPATAERSARDLSTETPAASWAIPAAAAVILLAGLAAYSNSFRGAFVYDDIVSICRNEHLLKLWPLSEAMSLAVPGGPTVSGRPILSLSLALNRALLGPGEAGYHVVNLAIHLCAAFLLFGLLRRTFGLAAFRGWFGGDGIWAALAAVLIWLVHPVQTASVTYIVQRAESLAGMFLLLTLYCAVRGFGSSRPVGWWAGAVAACALGMGTKEMAAAAPILVFLYDVTFVSRSIKSVLARRWRLYAALAATWLVLPGVFNMEETPQGETAFSNAWKYALTEPEVILFYLRLFVWPSSLAADYSWPRVQDVSAMLLPGAIIAVLVALAAWGVWRRHWLGFVGAWFFLILGPSSSFIPLTQTVQNQRMYLPLAALAVLAALGGVFLLRRLGGGRTARLGVLAALVAAVAGFGWATYERNKVYASPEAFWRDNVRQRPMSPGAWCGLGDALAWNPSGGLLGDPERLKEAVACYRKAVSIEPGLGAAHGALGLIALNQQMFDQAIAEFQAATSSGQDLAALYTDIGFAYEGKLEFDRAIEYYRLALLQQDHRATVRLQIHLNLGNVLVRLERYEEAIPHYEQALQLSPDCADAHFGLGTAAAGAGRADVAIGEFGRALQLNERDPKAHAGLAEMLARKGDFAAALEHYDRSLQLGGTATGVNNLAWLLATCPDAKIRNGVRAVSLAGSVCRATGYHQPDFLDTLAAAQAEAGQFDRAISTTQLAIDLAQKSGNSRLAEVLRGRLAEYQAHRPHREPVTP